MTSPVHQVLFAAAAIVSPTHTAFNPSDKSSNITLSGGNLTAVSSNTTDGAVRVTAGKSSGKYYWEFSAAAGASGADTGVGIATSTAGLGGIGPGPTGAIIAYDNLGQIWTNGGSFTGISLGAFAGHAVRVALDITNLRIWFAKDGGSWNTNGSADPATNTGGIDISSWANGATLHACTCFNASTGSHTINTGDSAFSFSVPSGFTSGLPI